MRKISMGIVLNTLCDYYGISKTYNRPISYENFKIAMMHNLIGSRLTVQDKWTQLLSHEELYDVKKSSSKMLIELKPTAVYHAIASEGIKPCFCDIYIDINTSETPVKEESQ